jgi:hypothetical protein
MNRNERQIRNRIRTDYPYYAHNFLKIRTKSGLIEKFTLNTVQKYLHQKLEEQSAKTGKVRAMILKGRQQGCSTYIGGRYYHRTTHYKGLRTFILTHELEATANLFNMVERFHEQINPAFRPSTGKSNRKELIFDRLDSGYRVGTAGTKAVGRSSTIQLFHGSEVAFWPNAADHAAGILQAIPESDGTEIILESTANGIGNYFHSNWQLAEVGDSDFIAVFIPWYWQDEYRAAVPDGFEPTHEEIKYQTLYNLTLDQIIWRRKKIIELGDPLLFKQEYPATAAEAFQTTGIESFIKAEDVMTARKNPTEKSRLPVIAGFDPARDGDDRDAFIYRQGPAAFDLEYKKFHTFPERIAYCLEKLTGDPYIDMLFIDYGGSGWEIAGMLQETEHADRVRVVNFGSEALKKTAYKNKRAEMYGELKKWLTDPNMPVSIPDSDALHGDMTAPSYTYDSHSRLCLERKKDIKKRGLRSPDGADALALTFAFPISNKKKKTAHPIPVKSYF